MKQKINIPIWQDPMFFATMNFVACLVSPSEAGWERDLYVRGKSTSMKTKEGLFQLASHGSTMKGEVLAGSIGFFTIVYIVAINALILAEAGIPFEGAVFATILASFVGCLVMAFWANAPILIVPGMGINAMFTYTLVESMGFHWQEALAVVLVSGFAFMLIAFSSLAQRLNEAIPASLKEAISVGLGLFLMLIGLEKGGLVVRGSDAIIALGDLSDLKVVATILTLLFTLLLFLRGVRGDFLWSILFGTGLAFAFGILPQVEPSRLNLTPYGEVFGHFTFDQIAQFPFWVAVFSMTMVLVFENLGLVQSHVSMAKQPEKYRKSLQATAVATFTSGLLGTSPTVATVESTAAIAAGGRTGLTALTTGILFLASIPLIPYMKWIPDSAIAPILIVIGSLMVQNIRHIQLHDLTEAFPAIFIIVMIPFTYSIANGIAIGFIMYPILKLVNGKGNEVSMPLYVVSSLFLLNFVLQYI